VPTFVPPHGDSTIAKKAVFRNRVFRKRMNWLSLIAETVSPDKAEGKRQKGQAGATV
jgi:hypothetical protein